MVMDYENFPGYGYSQNIKLNDAGSCSDLRPKINPHQGALIALMQRTGYSMVQQNGQRRYGGPPPDWEGLTPGRGCEVFVGKVPRDCFEDELVPVFESVGRIYELRLMMDFSGTNRGYCFVTYTNRIDAKKAVKDLDKYEIRKSRFIGVNFSVDNCRLYLGAIPRDKTQQDILVEMRRVTEGVVDTLVYPSSTDKTKNRGFAFVEYESHRAAALARKKIIPGKLELWGQHVIVDWAEPEQMVDEDVMEKVRNLYVRNLMPNTTEETLKYVFEHAAGEVGSVDRVKRIKDFAFVHFNDRELALKAQTAMNGRLLEGAVLEVALAKPVLKTCCSSYVRLQDKEFLKGCMHDCGLYGNECWCAAPKSPALSNFLARREACSPRESHLYDLQPDMVLTPADPSPQSHVTTKSALQLLEEVCLRNNWGSPQYQLHTTTQHMSGVVVKLYMYRVVIPALTSEQTESLFKVPRLCDDIINAREYAAAHVLQKLRVLVNDVTTHLLNQTSVRASQTWTPSPTNLGVSSTHQSMASTGPYNFDSSSSYPPRQSSPESDISSNSEISFLSSQSICSRGSSSNASSFELMDPSLGVAAPLVPVTQQNPGVNVPCQSHPRLDMQMYAGPPPPLNETMFLGAFQQLAVSPAYPAYPSLF